MSKFLPHKHPFAQDVYKINTAVQKIALPLQKGQKCVFQFEIHMINILFLTGGH